MTDYQADTIELIDDLEMFIQTISFNEDSISFEIIDKAKQSDTVRELQMVLLPITDKERFEFYEEVQNLARLLLVNAYVERRLANE